MRDDITSRWEERKSERKNDRKRLFLIALLISTPLVSGAVYGDSLASYWGTDTSAPLANSISAELRTALSTAVEPSNGEMKNALAVFSRRLVLVEAENKRLQEEMDGLLDHDGVIQKLATHIRALHAQNEATRRDVVGALTQPASEDPASEFSDQPDASGVYGEEAHQPQFLTKAKHTVVTPAAALEAPAAEKAAPAKKKTASVEPEEGATN